MKRGAYIYFMTNRYNNLARRRRGSVTRVQTTHGLQIRTGGGVALKSGEQPVIAGLTRNPPNIMPYFQGIPYRKRIGGLRVYKLLAQPQEMLSLSFYDF